MGHGKCFHLNIETQKKFWIREEEEEEEEESKAAPGNVGLLMILGSCSIPSVYFNCLVSNKMAADVPVGPPFHLNNHSYIPVWTPHFSTLKLKYTLL